MAMCWLAAGNEPVQYKRDLPPAHYTWEIQSFPILSKLDKYESKVFEVGGRKWRLSLYPEGDKRKKVSEYISLYLSIKETDMIVPGHKIHFNYKLFMHDKIRNNYWTVQEADGAVSSFDGSKTQWGFPKFLSLKKFRKPSNGFLKEDSCTFGAEVFVIHPPRIRESFSLITYPPKNTYSWKVQNWSTLRGTHHSSPAFPIEGRIWKLSVYPRGNDAEKEKSLSVYLEVQKPPKRKLYVDFKLRVVDQLKDKNKEKKVECWLCASNPKEGCADLMPLKELQKSAKQFLHNDALIVEVQICAISKESTISTK